MKPMYQSDPFTRRLPGATSSAIWILSLLALVEVGVMANATSYNPGMGAVAEDVQSGSNIDDVPTVSEASPSCNDILRLPVGEDRCAFARAHCPSEGVLPYFVMYHCYVAPYGVLPAMLTYTSLAAFLCLLFYVMGRAADEYFSSILSQISQDMGLPPRLAGVTLLALGNGAPDLSSSIAAVRAGHYHLALGALTGGSMFVGCVVAGRIIVTSDGVKCRGAQIRDVMMQFMAVALIVAIIGGGKVSYGAIAAVLLLYTAYVIVVAVADFSKRAGIEWSHVKMTLAKIPLFHVVGGLQTHESLGTPLLDQATLASEDAVQQHRDGSRHVDIAHRETRDSELQKPGDVRGRGSSALLHQNGPTVTVLPGALDMVNNGTASRFLDENESNSTSNSLAQKLNGIEVEMTSPPQSRTRSPNGSVIVENGGAKSSEKEHEGNESLDTTSETFTKGILHTSSSRSVGSNQQYEGSHAALENTQVSGVIERSQTLPSSFRVPSISSEHDHVSIQRVPDDLPSVVVHEPTYANATMRDRAARRSQTSAPVYDEIVHMSAREYRRRAWADIAAARSFYRRHSRTESTMHEEEDLGEEVDDEPVACSEEETEEGMSETPERQRLVDMDNAKMDAKPSTGYTPPDIRQLDARSRYQERRLNELTGGSLHQHPDAGQAENDANDRARQQNIIQEEPEIDYFSQKRHIVVALLTQLLRQAAFPVIVALKASIPMVEATIYKRNWFLLSVALSPVFICIYFVGFHFSSIVTAATVGCIASIAFAVATQNGSIDPPFWDMGMNGIPFGAAMIAMYGFVLAAMWIDVFASEIVGVLRFFGVMAGIHPAVLGVTVLAWGNSLTDLIANTSMAARSSAGTSMAMTACFAGPLFNMLVGLGIGFWTYLADRGLTSERVQLDLVIFVGCVFIMINCVCIVVAAVIRKPKHRLPGSFGWAMIFWYGVYVLVIGVIVLS